MSWKNMSTLPTESEKVLVCNVRTKVNQMAVLYREGNRWMPGNYPIDIPADRWQPLPTPPSDQRILNTENLKMNQD